MCVHQTKSTTEAPAIHSPCAAPLNITPEFLQPVPKPLIDSPTPHVAVISLKQRTRIPPPNRIVVVKSILEAKRPFEAQEGGVVVGELAGSEEGGVMVHEAVAEGGPGEHVDGYGVRG